MYGQDLLDTLASLPRTSNAAALLRHSKREALKSTTDPTTALLTEEGKEAARAFGQAIKGYEHLRLFHSPVPRCQQTASCIADGATAQGLHVEMLGTHDALGFGYTHDMAAACGLYFEIGEAFVSRWFSGAISESIISDPGHLAQTTLQHILPPLHEPSTRGRRLDLHVSHDWNVMVMRELLLGVRHEDAGWLSFLDGVAFDTPKEGCARAHYTSKRVEKALPWNQFIRR